MAANKVLSLQEEEVLAEEVRIKDAVFNAWKAVAEKMLNHDDGKKEISQSSSSSKQNK